jgi:hypothetical protein
MTAPIINPWKTPPGAGKFEAAYAWPLIPASVPAIQSTPTVVGATSPKNSIDFREVQFKNALSPTEVTLLGMVTEVKEVQPENAKSPMEVTLLGMVTEVKEGQ